MEAILHFIGLCPDNISHFDLIDLCSVMQLQISHAYNSINFIFNKVFQRKKIK